MTSDRYEARPRAGRIMSRRRRRIITRAKAQRALDAIVALMECDDYDSQHQGDLDRACDRIRDMREAAPS